MAESPYVECEIYIVAYLIALIKFTVDFWLQDIVLYSNDAEQVILRHWN